MAASSNKNKPKITYIDFGYRENGKKIKEHRVAVKRAEYILNSPTNDSKPRKRK